MRENLNFIIANYEGKEKGVGDSLPPVEFKSPYGSYVIYINYSTLIEFSFMHYYYLLPHENPNLNRHCCASYCFLLQARGRRAGYDPREPDFRRKQ